MNSQRILRSTSAWVVGTVLLASTVPTNRARAADQEFNAVGYDLHLRADWRWAGGGDGGYYPIRIRVVNEGEARSLTFEFKSIRGHKQAGARLTRRFDQNSTDTITLSVPLVGLGVQGEIRVYENGDELDAFTRSVQLPADSNSAGPAMLIVSETGPDTNALKQAITTIIHHEGGAATGYRGNPLPIDIYASGPVMLPDRWIDYTALDIVAVSADVLGRLSRDVRTAILKWTHTGGTLIVYNTGDAAQDSQRLKRLLELDALGESGGWRPASADLRREAGNLAIVVGPAAASGRRPSRGTTITRGRARFRWRPDAFASLDLMLGRVFAFPGNPFVATVHDWVWLLKSIGSDRHDWIKRHGATPRRDHAEFLHFLIPGVKGVPVYAFLLLITVFTIVIGPLNYLLLWKRKRLFLLVLSIPVIAFVTSLALFGYSMVSHGLAVKSRSRTLTILDQRTKTAVTSQRLALYAGLAPGSLEFDTDTAVYPIRPKGQEFESGTVDWTDGQSLHAGWLRSRTRTQFLTVSHRTERGRLVVGEPTAGGLEVSNGFEWDIELLIVADGRGKLYFTNAVAAGETATLKPLTNADRARFTSAIREHLLEEPDGTGKIDTRSMFRGMRYRGYPRYGPTQNAKYADGLAEKRLELLLETLSARQPIGTNAYAAILADSPDAPHGVDETRPESDLHVLIGYY